QPRGSPSALNDATDRRPVRADDQVTFPVSWHGAVGGFGGAFTEDHILGDVPLRLVLRPGSGHPQRSAGAQAGDQFSLERAPALDEQGLVDRLVTDTHGLILGVVDLKPV